MRPCRIHVSGVQQVSCDSLTTWDPPSLGHAEVSLLFLQPSGLATVLGAAKNLPTLKTIVTVGTLHAETKSILKLWSEQNDIKVFELTERTLVHPLEHQKKAGR